MQLSDTFQIGGTVQGVTERGFPNGGIAHTCREDSEVVTMLRM
tara:strand:- start:46579 stop:46707 length:129 start_codon:yes stop_codon:yes gene_type:complete